MVIHFYRPAAPLRRGAGAPLALDPAALARAFPDASACVVVLVHGLMNTEHVWGRPDEDASSAADYGSRLARDLGFTPLYVRYNSGLPIPDKSAARVTPPPPPIAPG